MSSVETLVAAFADEDRRLRELTLAFPVHLREAAPESGKLSLKQTLAHLAFWDRFTVEFFDARCHGRKTDAMSLGDFEERNRAELERTFALPFERVREVYDTATRELMGFLRDHWDDMDADLRANFNIPLKHRRHHRRLLSKAFPSQVPLKEAHERAG